jgi:hypothetical protein
VSLPPAEIVPGRSCGSCTLCCKLMQVAELDKPSDRWCPHVLQGKGCGIYAERPQSCHNFLCGYLSTAALSDAWYPARCKIVLSASDGGITALIDRSRPDVWRQAPYYEQFKSWSRVGSPKGRIMLVRIGRRAIVVLPDEDVDLGEVDPSDAFFVDIAAGPAGPRFRVRAERKGAA